MKFEALHEAIPYVTGGKQKILTMSPYPYITLAMPGRHAKDTLPIGGDFVVMVTDMPKVVHDEGHDPIWYDHQFTHTDLFKDLQNKSNAEPDAADCLMGAYLEVVKGANPEPFIVPGGVRFPGIHYKTLLCALQCLAVAEHRRYAVHEAKFGGRYLPFRFAAGIVEGLWTDTDAADKQKYGRPGAQQLERLYGTPFLTKKLMGLDDA